MQEMRTNLRVQATGKKPLDAVLDCAKLNNFYRCKHIGTHSLSQIVKERNRAAGCLSSGFVDALAGIDKGLRLEGLRF
jgi:hypothetical protein